MRKIDIRSILYSKEKSALDFNFDTLQAPSMFNFITVDDINYLYRIASSIRLSSKINEKYAMIDSLMKARGFYKLGSGTNRVVYRHYEYPHCVLKIAIDKVGLGDNPKEFKNQHLLKPFVAKMFECSPCGTVSWNEYVYPITNKTEFESIAGDVFSMITTKIIGKYILEDIGTKYFMNYGLRTGTTINNESYSFGPVLLDYPYVYKLDGAKLYCTRSIPELGIMSCDGTIDYDDGFNTLVCTKCGKKYLAKDLEDESANIKIKIEKDEEDLPMKVVLKKGDQIVYRAEESGVSSIDINADSIDVIGSKIESSIKIGNRKIPKRMKTVDLEKEEQNKIKQTNKKAEKIAKNLQNIFHVANEGRFVEPDYSKYEVKEEEQTTVTEEYVEPKIDIEKEFGLTPIQERETHKKKTGYNPYMDEM